MFGGYDIFKEAKIRRFCHRYPDSTLRPLPAMESEAKAGRPQ
ncbi:hypothetical protein [Thiolapillus sp.]|nr:hypothetical protein [Thiolapillus sp.]